MDPTTDTPIEDCTDRKAFAKVADKPRAVVIGVDDALRDTLMDHLAASGFEVVDYECQDDYDLSDGDERIRPSDVLVFSFREVTEARRDACRSVRRSHPKNPVVIELMNPKTFRYADLLLGARVVCAPVSRESLQKAVFEAWSAPNPIYEMLRR
tara:strand:- start:34 stop:495 length:462 start_codon:yes stop_codon:yes gene_type:complete